MANNNNTPRIYVASLAHYNGGELVGQWFDASDSELLSTVTEYIKSLPHPDGKECGDNGFCEEWAIHDYEGFGALTIEEYSSLDTVSELAQLIEEHGEAYAEYAAYVGLEHATVSDFQDTFKILSRGNIPVR